MHLVNCLVHIRQHFEQALDENREMAEYGLTQIQKVYQNAYDEKMEMQGQKRRQALRKPASSPFIYLKD